MNLRTDLIGSIHLYNGENIKALFDIDTAVAYFKLIKTGEIIRLPGLNDERFMSIVKKVDKVDKGLTGSINELKILINHG